MNGQPLTISNLSCGYARGEVLKDLTLPPCPAGAITSVIGPNAAGKTTLLRAIAGLLPARGEASFDGRNLLLLPSAERAELVTYMPQGVALTAIEAVITALRVVPAARADTEARIEAKAGRAVSSPASKVQAAALRPPPPGPAMPITSPGRARREI